MKTFVLSVAGLVLMSGLIGCSQEPANSPEPEETSSYTGPMVDGTKYLLTAEPDAAENVITVREAAKDGDEVTIEGRIGGSANPWIEQAAAFTIVDDSLKACSDIPGDQCTKPWDYCCERTKLPTSTALIKVVDDNGDLVETDARGLLKVKELSRVIVKGKAQRDEAGNLTVLASGVFIKKK